MRTSKRMSLVVSVLAAMCVAPLVAQAQEKRIVHLELKGPLLEAPQQAPFMMSSDKNRTTKQLIERLRQLRTDNSVAAVFITFESPSMGLAQVQEIRQAIQKLKAADKEVYIHLDACYSDVLYWLASCATRLAVVPTGDLWITGIYAEQLYVKDMLSALRMEADVIHIGDYKSAGEIVARNQPSEESAEMIDWLFDDIYRQMLTDIAGGRSMKVREFEKLLNNGPYNAEQALGLRLIDEVTYRKDFIDDIKERHGGIPIQKEDEDSGLSGFNSENPFAFFQEIFGKAMSAAGQDKTPGIGLVYVQGTIMVGDDEEGLFATENYGASSRLRKALYEAAYDDNIKAVVLRVDSPGGSAVASEIIWHATQVVAQRKPFVVSMGNVAGSGGYYVSCGADTIFAEPGTITGSIGVIGLKFVTKSFWEWLGVHWYPVQRGENADIMASNEPWNESEREKIRTWMSEVYGVFKSHVQAKRGQKLAKPLDELAGGRVFTGAQALDLGLVDKLGGLNDALNYAAMEAGLGDDYEVRIIPKPKTIFEILMEGFGMESRVRAGTSANGSSAFDAALPLLRRLEPQKARAFETFLEQLELLQRERAVLIMPNQIVIR